MTIDTAWALHDWGLSPPTEWLELLLAGFATASFSAPPVVSLPGRDRLEQSADQRIPGSAVFGVQATGCGSPSACGSRTGRDLATRRRSNTRLVDLPANFPLASGFRVHD